MSQNVDSEKTTEIVTRVPFNTNGEDLAPGKHRVPMSVAADLERRQYEFDADERRLLKNNGEDIDALNGGTLRG